MAYGDSVNWDGKLSTASSTSYKVDWRVYWRGTTSRPFLESELTLFGGDDAKDAAEKLADGWNVKNPSGRQAAYDALINEQQVTWGGAPDAMEFRVSGSAWQKVEYGSKVAIISGEDLYVFLS